MSKNISPSNSDSKKNDLVPVDEALCSEFKALYVETGVAPIVLRREHRQSLQGLDIKQLDQLIGRRGNKLSPKNGKQTMPRYLVEAIREAWSTYPKRLKRNQSEIKIPVTADMLKKLKGEILRTRIVPHTFTEKYKSQIAGLSYNTLRMVLKREEKTIYESVWGQICEYYAAIPDAIIPVKSTKKVKPLNRKNNSLGKKHYLTNFDNPPIPSEKLALLQHYHRVLGIVPGRIFEEAENIPTGLNRYAVGRWISEKTVTAKPEDLYWVLSRCEKLIWEALAGPKKAPRRGGE